LESSDEARAKFAAKLDNERRVLEVALRRATALHSSLREGDYAAIATEKSDGGLTDDARDAIYGRAYLRTLNDYARMLLNANARSPTALRSVQQISKFLESLDRDSPRGLARKLGSLMRAESREQTLAAFATDRTTLKGLNIPDKRAEMTARTNRAVVAAARLETRWKRNLFFTRTIAPYMRKSQRNHCGAR
jgi:hypothetical protein